MLVCCMHFALSDLLAEYAGSALLTANTLRLHQTGCKHFSAFLGRTALVSDLTDATLCRYISSRVAAGKSRATVRGEVAKLLALWRYAAKRHYVDEWPTVRPPRAPERAPLAWSRGELDKLFAATQLAGPVGSVPGFLWWGALASCLWDTGERIGAMLSLEWYGVDLEGLTLLLPAEVRKGQTRDRVYRIAGDTAQRLALLPRDRNPFFWPYHESTLYNRYKRLLQRAGLPCDRRSKFHRIRRSTASHYAAAGGDATELLGHSSRAVTRLYLDPRLCGPPPAVDLLFRPGVPEDT